jgi:hypothetical protein
LHAPQRFPRNGGFSRQDELLMHGMQRILAKFMKDSVVRGRVLLLLYERRGERSISFGHA